MNIIWLVSWLIFLTDILNWTDKINKELLLVIIKHNWFRWGIFLKQWMWLSTNVHWQWINHCHLKRREFIYSLVWWISHLLPLRARLHLGLSKLPRWETICGALLFRGIWQVAWGWYVASGFPVLTHGRAQNCAATMCITQGWLQCHLAAVLPNKLNLCYIIRQELPARQVWKVVYQSEYRGPTVLTLWCFQSLVSYQLG